jgi:hypothetical protein
VLTSAVGSASKRSLIVMFTVSGQVPCSGAQRQDKGLDEVSTAIHGGAAAMNANHQRRAPLARPLYGFVMHLCLLITFFINLFASLVHGSHPKNETGQI